MKHLYLIFCICMQVAVANAAQAGSPFEAYQSNPETLFRCLWVAAGSEENKQEQEESETEDEEEPDCD